MYRIIISRHDRAKSYQAFLLLILFSIASMVMYFNKNSSTNTTSDVKVMKVIKRFSFFLKIFRLHISKQCQWLLFKLMLKSLKEYQN